MTKDLELISRDSEKKTMKIKMTYGSETKEVTIKDYQDEAENFRAACRELHKFEKEVTSQPK